MPQDPSRTRRRRIAPSREIGRSGVSHQHAHAGGSESGHQAGIEVERPGGLSALQLPAAIEQRD